MLNTKDKLNDFTKQTKLVLRKTYNQDDEYYEVSGKSYNTIKTIIQEYNKNNNAHVRYINDYNKDVTIIQL